VFVLNRLIQIQKLCQTHSVQFGFILGIDTPSDCITRCLSYKQLVKTNYISHPELDVVSESRSANDLMLVIIPGSFVKPNNVVSSVEHGNYCAVITEGACKVAN
jgi:hypothetical protein